MMMITIVKMIDLQDETTSDQTEEDHLAKEDRLEEDHREEDHQVKTHLKDKTAKTNDLIVRITSVEEPNGSQHRSEGTDHQYHTTTTSMIWKESVE